MSDQVAFGKEPEPNDITDLKTTQLADLQVAKVFIPSFMLELVL